MPETEHQTPLIGMPVAPQKQCPRVGTRLQLREHLLSFVSHAQPTSSSWHFSKHRFQAMPAVDTNPPSFLTSLTTPAQRSTLAWLSARSNARLQVPEFGYSRDITHVATWELLCATGISAWDHMSSRHPIQPMQSRHTLRASLVIDCSSCICKHMAWSVRFSPGNLAIRSWASSAVLLGNLQRSATKNNLNHNANWLWKCVDICTV